MVQPWNQYILVNSPDGLERVTGTRNGASVGAHSSTQRRCGSGRRGNSRDANRRHVSRRIGPHASELWTRTGFG